MSISKHITYPVPTQGPAPEPEGLQTWRPVALCDDCNREVLVIDNRLCANPKCGRSAIAPGHRAHPCRGSNGFCCVCCSKVMGSLP